MENKSFISRLTSSSSNPEQMSMTVKGLGVLLIPVIVRLAELYGISGLDESFMTTVLESVTEAIQAVTLATGSVLTALGFLRKVFNAFKNKTLA